MSDNGNHIKDELHEVTSIMAKSAKKRSKTFIVLAFLFVLALIVTLPMGAKFAIEKYADKKLTSFLSLINDPCYVIYEKSEYDIISRHLRVSNVSVICQDEEAARFAFVDFDNIRLGSPIPESLSAKITKGVVNIDAKIFGQYGKLAGKLGYGPVEFSGDVTLSYDETSKVFKMEKLSAKANGIGSLQCEFEVGNIDSDSLLGAVKQILNNDYTSLWVSFKDDGFMNKTIARYAGTINSDENSAKSRALHGIERRISGKFKDNAFAKEQLVQIYRFIENPTIITAKSEDKTASLMAVVKSLSYSGWRSFVHSIEFLPLTLYSN